jgi:methionyl-tRNA synthetase
MATKIGTRSIPAQTVEQHERTRRLQIDCPVGESPRIEFFRQIVEVDANGATVSAEENWANRCLSLTAEEFAALVPEYKALLETIPKALDLAAQRIADRAAAAAKAEAERAAATAKAQDAAEG